MVDLSGFWGGRYSYRGNWRQPVDFDVEIAQTAGELSGVITEPNTFMPGGLNLLCADITGLVRGRTVSFVKTYREGSGGHSIRYHGTVLEDGTYIEGEWRGDASIQGTFSMRRDKGEFLSAPELEEEVTLFDGRVIRLRS